MRRHPPRALNCVAAVLALSATAVLGTYGGSATAAVVPAWMISEPVLESVAPYLTTPSSFQNSNTYAVAQSSARTFTGTAVTAHFTSEPTLAAAIADGGLPAGTTTVIYDPESWSQTPLVEQQNVGYYMGLAVQAAHAGGLQIVVAPALDLMSLLVGTGAPEWSEYLSYGMARVAAASGADIVAIQSQSLEGALGTYSQFVTSAVSQVLRVNPRTGTFAGLTTNLVALTPQTMVQAEEAVISVVHGFWMNVPVCQSQSDCYAAANRYQLAGQAMNALQ